MDPNLDSWLNHKNNESKILYAPKNIKLDFKEWIERCHKDLDQEILLKEKIVINRLFLYCTIFRKNCQANLLDFVYMLLSMQSLRQV